MFDFSWSEIMLIGAVALIVIGPKDLPRVLRTAGQWARKARAISREFQSTVEQMIREAELDDVKKELDKATSIDLESEFQKTIDPTGSLAEHLAPPELPSPAESPSPPELPAPPERPALAESAPADAAPLEHAAPAAVPPSPAEAAPASADTKPIEEAEASAAVPAEPDGNRILAPRTSSVS